jgi:hypothetical protein
LNDHSINISVSMNARNQKLGRFADDSKSAMAWGGDAAISGEVEFKGLLENFHAVGKRFHAVEPR